MSFRDRLRAFVERLLPWYEPAREEARDAETERIRQRSIRTRKFAERRLAGYQSVRLKR